MAFPSFMSRQASTEIKTIEMHTTGEPTRIIYSGFPDLRGTLLEQRAEAMCSHDFFRQAVINEPRGHSDMYGAVLRPSTEMVESGQAHIGALFMTNEGYSTMCGHATIALGRMLVDCDDVSIFPRRSELDFNKLSDNVELRLHVPCGIVTVLVPTIQDEQGIWRADGSRPVSYLSVPSFVAGSNVDVPIPPGLRWPELDNRQKVTVDLSYGGTFYILCGAPVLGFPSDLHSSDMTALQLATKNLKASFNASEELRKLLVHSDSEHLQFLYSVILTEKLEHREADHVQGAETGLCFFADQQIDRSPTGSGVQARVALAFTKGERRLGQSWMYHSFVSQAHSGRGGFEGTAVQEVNAEGRKAIIVKVSGYANYTGASSLIIEPGDDIGRGFRFHALG